MNIFKRIFNNNNTLFIIGNGFDRANKLPTSYNDFRIYLDNTHDANNIDLINKTNYRMAKNGVQAPNDTQNSIIIYKMITNSLKRNFPKNNETLWCDFEEVLGKLRYEDLWDYDNKIDINGVVVHLAFTRLRDYFNKWITNIDLSKASPIKNFPKDNDKTLYITFNYTELLETVYHVPSKKICYIHGKRNVSDELIFGHKYIEEAFDTNSVDRQIAIVKQMLVKDVIENLQANYKFFSRLRSHVKIIISIGFSYGEVDELYIIEIIKRINKNAIWYLYEYDSKETQKQIKLIQKYGFKGKILPFYYMKELTHKYI